MIQDAALSTAAQRLRSGAMSAEAYRTKLLDRIDAQDGEIAAFVPADDRKKRTSRSCTQLTETYTTRADRPSLFGIPVGVKDIFHVNGMETRAGSGVPPAVLAGPQAASVTAAENAGAYVLGKTVTAEFAYFEPGPTRNPHQLEHTPGGSSSGSAAAVAAGMVPLALGTQTIGSVNRPAAFCGVVGVKPSFDRISTAGVIPAAPSVDHVGYFTQDVVGAQIAGSVLCTDWRPESTPSEIQPKVGVPTGPYVEQADDIAIAAFDQQIDQLKANGYTVREIPIFEEIETINNRHKELVAAEMALVHEPWYREYGDRYAPETAELIEEGRSVSTDALAVDRASRSDVRAQIHSRMDDTGVDVLVSPPAPGPAPRGIETTGDPIMNLPWTHAGVPAVTLPIEKTADGLPIGIQCTARFGDDEWLLHWCRSIEATFTEETQ